MSLNLSEIKGKGGAGMQILPGCHRHWGIQRYPKGLEMTLEEEV